MAAEEPGGNRGPDTQVAGREDPEHEDNREAHNRVDRTEVQREAEPAGRQAEPGRTHMAVVPLPLPPTSFMVTNSCRGRIASCLK